MIQSLDQVIHYNTGFSLYSSPGFYRFVPAEMSCLPEPLLELPSLPDEKWASEWHRRVAPVHPLGCYLANDIVVAGDGYLFSAGRPIYQRDVVVPYIQAFIEKGIHIPEKEQTIDKPAVLAFDRGYKTYGHVLLDTLPRLFIFEQMFAHLDEEYSVLIPADMPPWALAILKQALPKLFKKFESIDFSKYSVRVRRAVIPTHTHNYYQFHPFTREIFREIYVRSNADAANTDESFKRRLFVSRKYVNRPNNRMMSDWVEIEKIAADMGIFILHPENCSWTTQLKYFSQAGVIIGEYGSALHNTVFSPSGTITLALNRLQFLQSSLAALNRQKLAYLLPIENGETDGKVWYRIGVERAEKAIKHVLSLSETLSN